MQRRNSVIIPILLFCCSITLSAQDSLHIAESDTSVSFSKLDFLNTYAKAAGVEMLSDKDSSNTGRLRLWIPLSHSMAARFLDIHIGSDQINGKWYASWANSSETQDDSKLKAKWNCISDINTVSTAYGSTFGCLIAVADQDDTEGIRDHLLHSGFIELLHQPIEERSQLDGKSLLVELLDRDDYTFVSFMNYHIENHPQKKMIQRARQVFGMWQN
ncbi:MAG TPA: hypothetical protein VJ941_01935 [Gracilimonas sp.]|nr:hypothetical protein [Gracilimonas sp.]